MPQIEIPFTPGQRALTKDGDELGVFAVIVARGGFTVVDDDGLEWDASELTLVEPVIEWVREEDFNRWIGDFWCAYDNGVLWHGDRRLGKFDNPRAIAEKTQKMWNEARKG